MRKSMTKLDLFVVYEKSNHRHIVSRHRVQWKFKIVCRRQKQIIH